MDIECPNCGEPWDSYHMRHDEAYEWGLSKVDLETFLQEGRFHSQNDPILVAAQSVGWIFSTQSVYSFTQCPCCDKKSILRDAVVRKNKTAVLADLLDGDEDALISMLAG